MAHVEKLIGRLVQHQVDFVIVGGFAAIAHGCSIRTQDLDVCCDFSGRNLLRLQAALDGIHPVHRMHPRRPPLALTPETCEGWKNLNLDTDEGQLDCLGSIAGVGGFQEVRRESIEVQLPAGRCRVLGLDALIRAKEAAGRRRDKEAVLQLIAIRDRLRREQH
jgi:hypothetical protein